MSWFSIRSLWLRKAICRPSGDQAGKELRREYWVSVCTARRFLAQPREYSLRGPRRFEPAACRGRSHSAVRSGFQPAQTLAGEWGRWSERPSAAVHDTARLALSDCSSDRREDHHHSRRPGAQQDRRTQPGGQAQPGNLQSRPRGRSAGPSGHAGPRGFRLRAPASWSRKARHSWQASRWFARRRVSSAFSSPSAAPWIKRLGIAVGKLFIDFGGFDPARHLQQGIAQHFAGFRQAGLHTRLRASSAPGQSH